MRLNVYSQELTKEIELVSKVADTGITYYGVRLYLASPDILHHSEDDDDRSAITFWLPNARSFTKDDLAQVFHEMTHLILDAPDVPRNDWEGKEPMRSFTHEAVIDPSALRYIGSVHGRKLRDFFPAIEAACERFSAGEAVTGSNWRQHDMPPVIVKPAGKGGLQRGEEPVKRQGTTRPAPPEGARFERLMHMRDGDIEHTGDAVYIAMMAAAQPLTVDYTVSEA